MAEVPGPENGITSSSTVTTHSSPELEPAQTSLRPSLLQATIGVRYSGFDLWLHRITMLLLVFVCAVVGVLLVIFPWRPEWTDNHLLLSSPGLRAFLANGFVRGACSGLGLLDIWIGFWEAIHYQEMKRR
jgi:hypothetical protein